MDVLILNNTGESLTIQDFFINDPSRGSGYYGDTNYFLPPNGRKLLSDSKFTRLTMKEVKPIEVHIKINGEKRLVLHHYDFEKKEAIVFVTDNEGNLSVNVVPRRAAIGFAARIRVMFPSRISAANIEALIAAAEPLNG